MPIPTMQVPPDASDVATATVWGPDGKPTTTSDVTTFVQGYTGGGGRSVEVGGGGGGRVWWLLLTLSSAAFGVMAL